MISSLNTFGSAALLLSALNLVSAAPVVVIREAVVDDNVNNTISARGNWPKRGLPFNNPPKFIRNFKGPNSQVNWAYNWESFMTPDFPSYLEFVPMLWGTGDDKIKPWASNAASALARGSGHLLAFNEPDACFWGAACLSPSDAASAYRIHLQPFASRASLGAPAVTSDQSGGLKGLAWLKEFMKACNGCQIDFIPIHWYGVWNQDDNFREHVKNAGDIAGAARKVWITEFRVEGTDSQRQEFLKRNMAWLDQQDYVERYSWFSALPEAAGCLVNEGGGLNALGDVYAWTPFG